MMMTRWREEEKQQDEENDPGALMIDASR